ncbi:hypothetical protein CTM88_19215 [Photobacterium aquimaris]|uniref:Uncharacterized protein n=2 Tax=Photobacterium aquimaris TaxID=512643 RepID=A0A2T3IF34_9GAMM|nr:hypothetical protein AYY20_12820 [Photobacterium aquimaris]PSU24109.1 hypothetical protein CTM88_19215 [Photobacterium aquimaris]
MCIFFRKGVNDMSFHKDIDLLLLRLREDAVEAKEGGNIQFATGMHCARVLIEETLKQHGYRKPVIVESPLENSIQNKE